MLMSWYDRKRQSRQSVEQQRRFRKTQMNEDNRHRTSGCAFDVWINNVFSARYHLDGCLLIGVRLSLGITLFAA